MGIKAQSVLVISLLCVALSCDKGNPADNNSNDNDSTVTDIDGNVYQTIKIGSQVWTKKNLRTTRYNDGSAIPNIVNDSTWDSCSYTQTGAYCYYNNTTNADSIEKFGAFYNWYAVDTKKIAPKGWHVPTDADWVILQNYLITNGYNWDGTTAGNKIAKSLAAKTDWYPSIGAGAIGNDLTTNNRSGFSALPGGSRFRFGYFLDIGSYGYWWSATENDASIAILRYLSFGYDFLNRYYELKNSGFSVRLLKD